MTGKKKLPKKAKDEIKPKAKAIPKADLTGGATKDIMEVIDAKIIKKVAEEVFEAVLVFRIDPSQYSTEWEAQKFRSVKEAVAFLSTVRTEKWFIVSGSQLKVTSS